MCEYIIDKEGKKRKAVKIICEYCGKEFLKPERFIKKHKHDFCSKQCSYNFQKTSIKLTCAYCGKEFERKPSKLACSKSGIYFCSRQCKDEAQKINNEFKAIQPSHYGITKHTDYTPQHVYQRICFSKHQHKCCICGEEKIIAVHHYDNNHNNNEISNLIPLCPTHHCYIHSKYKDEIIDKVEEYRNNFIKNNGL